MTAFTIGMLAAALWGVAIIALILLTRGAPSNPSKSMREFRKARRSLVPHRPSSVRAMSKLEPANGPKLEVHEEMEMEPKPDEAPRFIFQLDESRQSELAERARLVQEPSPISDHPAPSPTEEDLDLTRVLDSITRPGPSKEQSRDTPARTKTPSRPRGGPRKTAGVTYILVDEAGKPLL